MMINSKAGLSNLITTVVAFLYQVTPTPIVLYLASEILLLPAGLRIHKCFFHRERRETTRPSYYYPYSDLLSFDRPLPVSPSL